MRRVTIVLALTLLTVVGVAAPAAAHTRASDATNFDGRIVDTPGLAGVTWRTYDGGLIIEVVNDGLHELVVLGYEGEPYVRIGPDGVSENLNSPAAYVNRDRYADVAVPPRADPTAAPDWVRIGDEPRHAWHDHRAHWMSPELPPVVADAPGDHHVVMAWTIPVRVGGDSHLLVGELHWDPPTPPAFWAVLVGALAAVAVAGFTRVRDRGTLLRIAAATVAVVAVLNTVHLVDEVTARPEPLLDVLFGLLHTLLFTGAGLAAAWWVWHPRDGRRLVLGIGAGAVLFHQGLLHLPVLANSHVETVWPVGLIRGLVVASLVQAAVAAAAVWMTRTDDRVPGDPEGFRAVVANRPAQRGPTVPREGALRPVDADGPLPTIDIDRWTPPSTPPVGETMRHTILIAAVAAFEIEAG